MYHRFTVLAILALIFNKIHCQNTFGKDDVDVFDVLISLYKLNPLKNSNVYKTFTENIFIRSHKKSEVLPMDSNESYDKLHPVEIEELKAIEDVIHTKHKKVPIFDIDDPDYKVDNIKAEIFDGGIELNSDEHNKKKARRTVSKKIFSPRSIDNVIPNYIMKFASNKQPDAKFMENNQQQIPDLYPAEFKKWLVEKKLDSTTTSHSTVMHHHLRLSSNEIQEVLFSDKFANADATVK